MNNMNREIIDIQVKGNVIRFYLGENGKQSGDDWDDISYESNAGQVYDKFVKGTVDFSFPFDWDIREICQDHYNSNFMYKDFVNRKAAKYTCSLGNKNVSLLFGDKIDDVLEKLKQLINE